MFVTIYILKILKFFINTIFLHEWIFKIPRTSNGGYIVAIRALLTSLSITVIIIISYKKVCLDDLCLQKYEDYVKLGIAKLSWFGAFFAITYAGLYARFASQWTYLANLYNLIKQTEACNNNVDKKIMDGWKAAFIEDALSLHLAYKTMFLPVVYCWLRNEDICRIYCEYSLGGDGTAQKYVKNVRKYYTAFSKQLEKAIERVADGAKKAPEELGRAAPDAP